MHSKHLLRFQFHLRLHFRRKNILKHTFLMSNIENVKFICLRKRQQNQIFCDILSFSPPYFPQYWEMQHTGQSFSLGLETIFVSRNSQIFLAFTNFQMCFRYEAIRSPYTVQKITISTLRTFQPVKFVRTCTKFGTNIMPLQTNPYSQFLIF